MSNSDTDTTTSAIPGRTACPACGARPTDETLREQRLSAIGYLHEDVYLECREAECGQQWTCGVPEGVGTRFAEDLWCSACSGWLRVHRIQPTSKGVYLHLKCPNFDPSPCPACEATVTPRVTPDGLVCPACDSALEREDVDGCYHFTSITREAGPEGYVLVGWPHITGDVAAAGEAFGYPTPDPDETDE